MKHREDIGRGRDEESVVSKPVQLSDKNYRRLENVAQTGCPLFWPPRNMLGSLKGDLGKTYSIMKEKRRTYTSFVLKSEMKECS